MLVSAGLIALAVHLSPPVVVVAVGVAVLGFVLLALVSSALRGVYTAALYRYASTGQTGFFDPTVMGGAFRSRH
jgi:hypothetical protein